MSFLNYDDKPVLAKTMARNGAEARPETELEGESRAIQGLIGL